MRQGLLQLQNLPANPHPYKTLPLQIRNHPRCISFRRNRRQQNQTRSLHPATQALHNVPRRHPLQLLTCDWIVRSPHCRIENAQKIMKLRHRRNRRPRIRPATPLLDRNRRTQPLDRIHLRLLQLVQKLPCIHRQGLDIPPLPLGIERVKGQRRLPAPAHPCHHNQLPPRKIQIDPLQIMLPRPPNLNHAPSLKNGS